MANCHAGSKNSAIFVVLSLTGIAIVVLPRVWLAVEFSVYMSLNCITSHHKQQRYIHSKCVFDPFPHLMVLQFLRRTEEKLKAQAAIALQ